jgi:hypothetical protein
MTLDHPLDDGQAHPFPRGGVGMQPLERLEYLCPARFRNAQAVVLDVINA